MVTGDDILAIRLPKSVRGFTENGWFRTGDIGAFDDNGRLRIVGRKKEMIFRGSADVFPRELEEFLYEHPSVRNAAVIGVPDACLGEQECCRPSRLERRAPAA